MCCGRGLAHTTFLETSLFFFTPFSLLLFSLPVPGGEGRSHGKERGRVGKVGLSSLRWGNWTEPPQGSSSRPCWGWPGPLVTIRLLCLSPSSTCGFAPMVHLQVFIRSSRRARGGAGSIHVLRKRKERLREMKSLVRGAHQDCTPRSVQLGNPRPSRCHLSRGPTITSAPVPNRWRHATDNISDARYRPAPLLWVLHVWTRKVIELL